jgi:hypothetical protein
LIVADIVDLDTAGGRASHDHVGFAEAREIAETHDLPIHADRTQEGGVGDVVLADIVDLEAARAVAQVPSRSWLELRVA